MHALNAPEKPLSVLLISPHPTTHGGVVAYAETLKSQLTHCDVSSFYVGSRREAGENAFTTIRRLITDPFAIAKRVKQQAIEIVHLNPSLNAKSAIRDGLILLALRLTGFCNTLVYFHGWQKPVERFIRRMPGLRQLARWLLSAGHVVVLAEEFRQGLMAIGIDGARITVTRTMFNGTSISTPPAVKKFHGKTILFLSRFVREKGMFELLEAFARIAADYPDTNLVLAGDGEEKKGLEALVADLKLQSRVMLPGYVGGKEKAELLSSCTLFALPTYFPEGMPVCLLEAMAAGKPLLTSSIGGIGHIIRDPDNGVVLERITAKTVEAGLRRILSDASYSERIGIRNHAYAWAHFEPSRVSAEIEAMYRRIAAR